MRLLHYFPTLRSEKFLYAVTINGDVDYVTSDVELTLSDVEHLSATAIEDVSAKGWRSPNGRGYGNY